LGYPILNRFDPRATPGLSDVKTYAAMVSGTAGADAGHVRYRVLVPGVARMFYRLARGRIGSWDPVLFSLLVADSLFVSGTAVLIVFLGTSAGGVGSVGSYSLALAGALLYLLNFAVANLRLVGLVDAGEGLFLLALLVSLAEDKLWLLPPIAVLGALTKESFIPFSIVFTVAWWLCDRGDERRGSKARAGWILSSWMLSLATMVGVQWVISGSLTSPLEFGLQLHRGHDYAAHLGSALWDRNLWYIFLWLLPTAIPNLRRLPRTWLMATGATCGVAFVLDTYYGAAPGTVGRALFSIAGPVLSLSSARLLARTRST
jgi:hypothetical protein